MNWKQTSRFGMKLALGQAPSPKRIISIDVGVLSTGIAISCPSLQKPYLLKVLKESANSSKYLQRLKQTIAKQRDIKGIIVGKPVFQQSNERMTIDLSEGNMNKNELLFCFQDERWSTLGAHLQIEEMKKVIQYHGHAHRQKELEDGIGAMKIMERFLNYFNNRENK